MTHLGQSGAAMSAVPELQHAAHLPPPVGPAAAPAAAAAPPALPLLHASLHILSAIKQGKLMTRLHTHGTCQI